MPFYSDTKAQAQSKHIPRTRQLVFTDPSLYTKPLLKSERADSGAFSEFGATKKTKVAKPAKPAKVVKAKPVKKSSTKPTVKITKTKTPYSLTPDKNVVSTTVIRSNSNVGGLNTSSGGSSIFNIGTPPPYTVVSSTAHTSIKDSLLGLASQLISGFGRNPTVQTADGQVPIYNIPSQQQQTVYDTSEVETGTNNGGVGANVGSSLGGGFDGIIQWASANPLIVAGFGFGMYLLFKQPPGRGR